MLDLDTIFVGKLLACTCGPDVWKVLDAYEIPPERYPEIIGKLVSLMGPGNPQLKMFKHMLKLFKRPVYSPNQITDPEDLKLDLEFYLYKGVVKFIRTRVRVQIVRAPYTEVVVDDTYHIVDVLHLEGDDKGEIEKVFLVDKCVIPNRSYDGYYWSRAGFLERPY